MLRNKNDESRMEIEKVKSENKVIIENLEVSNIFMQGG